eukprot:TRINITY_DN723_c0_g1_i2.p1 TRINITY_DN723_c0_g1~~TRINITY_DN723_c0_g1_i2.p1  ORF type:complete len:281 (-),score=24.40 TRINITY_DN723_c0_g1_i2:382-1128(-)
MASNAQNGDAKPKALSYQKGILQSEALHQYILDTSVFPRETEILKEMRELGENHPWGLMTLSADEAQFLMMLLKLMNAKNTMEIGVFTGYSLLCTALSIPHDGKIIAIDIDRENYDLGRPIIEKAGVAHKIDFREGDALAILDEILNKNEIAEGSLDFVFVDADKRSYLAYHERILKLVKVGGVIAYDNTLWFGSVVDDESHPLRKAERLYALRDSVLKLNKALAADQRIEISQISIGDGLTLCRRLV